MGNPSLFSERKAAEAAAFFLHKAGGVLPLIKLIKLMYLAERQSFLTYGEPLTGDRLVSMPHGPVLSNTLNYVNGAVQSPEGAWESWISDRADHMVGLRDPSMVRTPQQDLLSLSESDTESLDQVWSKFGHWDKWVLVKYTHEHLPEWEDPEGSSNPIMYSKLFAVLGYQPDEVSALLDRLSTQGQLNNAFC